MKLGRPGKRRVYFLLLAAGFLIGATVARQCPRTENAQGERVAAGRRTAHVDETERTVYTNTSNKELKPRVMRLVNDIRQLVYVYKKKDGELLAASDKRGREDTARDERKRAREQWIKESDAAHDATMRQYKERYWADAILLRNELVRRLPKNLRLPQLAAIYQYPTNLLGVEAIADNLELLAKSLPD
jgi:hypothetical protein